MALLHRVTELLSSVIASRGDPIPASTKPSRRPGKPAPPLRVSFAKGTVFTQRASFKDGIPKDKATYQAANKTALVPTKPTVGDTTSVPVATPGIGPVDDPRTTESPPNKRNRRRRRSKKQQSKGNHRAAKPGPIPAPTGTAAPAPGTSEEALLLSELQSVGMPMHYACFGNAFNPDTGRLAGYKELSQSSHGEYWQNSCVDEFGRLLNGHAEKPDIGTNTMRPIKFHDIPTDRRDDITYNRNVCAYRPEKENPYRFRLTVGGDRINYPNPTTAPTADLTTCKLLANSVVSTPGARFATIDLKDYYLGTPMDRPEYMRIRADEIPQKIFDQYNLQDYVHNGWVYFEINRRMYGLPKAGRIVHQQLVKFLVSHDFVPVGVTPGLWLDT